MPTSKGRIGKGGRGRGIKGVETEPQGGEELYILYRTMGKCDPLQTTPLLLLQTRLLISCQEMTFKHSKLITAVSTAL